MARTKKGSGGIWDIFARKAKPAAKIKTRRKIKGLRQRHHVDPINTILEKYEGRNCSEWEL